jgi:thiol:disulfide interchange protein DsbC
MLPLVLALVGAASLALAAGETKPDTAAIKHTIESRFPGTKILDVAPSAMPGLYEVFVGSRILYTNETGDYLLTGSLIDTKTRANLTDERMSVRGRVDFHTLPFDKAIKIVKGDGSRQLAVFSDPDCPYCQQLEREMAGMNNLTVYIFLFPLGSVHPQAPARAHAIWCSKDRVQTWHDWMLQRKVPPLASCSGDPVDALQKLGDSLYIESTPTSFLANGNRVLGAVSASELEKLLQSAR